MTTQTTKDELQGASIRSSAISIFMIRLQNRRYRRTRQPILLYGHDAGRPADPEKDGDAYYSSVKVMNAPNANARSALSRRCRRTAIF
jgi:hypothetical protein